MIDGYVEVPKEDYASFSQKWINEAARVLKPGGSAYIFSGYTNLLHILQSLHQSGLKEINHIIWKYNFGVFTKKKYVSSHYHILYWAKPPLKDRVFNRFSRFGSKERSGDGGSLQYQDLEDVWVINREYMPGRRKNKNQLPSQLLIKMIQYSSNIGDVICDFFLGSFSTAKVARGMGRSIVGFELNTEAFTALEREILNMPPRLLLESLKYGKDDTPKNAGKAWTEDEIKRLWERYDQLWNSGKSIKDIVFVLCEEFKRGRFAISKILKGL